MENSVGRRKQSANPYRQVYQREKSTGSNEEIIIDPNVMTL